MKIKVYSQRQREVHIGTTETAPDWAVSQLIRKEGTVLDICKHGVGHPNANWVKRNKEIGKARQGSHACCGCCKEEK